MDLCERMLHATAHLRGRCAYTLICGKIAAATAAKLTGAGRQPVLLSILRGGAAQHPSSAAFSAGHTDSCKFRCFQLICAYCHGAEALLWASRGLFHSHEHDNERQLPQQHPESCKLGSLQS